MMVDNIVEMQERVARRAARILLRPDETNPSLTCVRFTPNDLISTSYSGEQPFYVTAKNLTQAPAGRRELYRLFNRQIRSRALSFIAVGGVKSGGVVPGFMVSEEFNKPFVLLYDKEKDHGISQDLSGVPAIGDILAVDDSVNSGLSVINSLPCLGRLKDRVTVAAALMDYDLPQMYARFEEAKIAYQGLTNIRVIVTEGLKMRFFTDNEAADIMLWHAIRCRNSGS